MTRPLVSIITPVWNVSNYIENFLLSIINQTYKNIEIIIVDDCTPDDSIEKIKDIFVNHANKNIDIKIYKHNINLGVGAARKTGLKNSKGDYVIFLDSDDYFEPNFIEEMISSVINNKSDIVICDYFTTYKDKEIYNKQFYEGIGIGLSKSILLGEIQGFLWNKLIKRELFIHNKIDFVNGLNMWEDVSVIIRISYFASNVSYVNKAFIHYNQNNSNSYSTKKISEKSLYNIIDVVKIIEDFLSDHPFENSDYILKIFKLRAKFFCLVNAKGKFRNFVNKLYPNTNFIYLKKPLIPIYSNIIHLFAFLRLYCFIDLLYILINKIKSILR